LASAASSRPASTTGKRLKHASGASTASLRSVPAVRTETDELDALLQGLSQVDEPQFRFDV